MNFIQLYTLAPIVFIDGYDEPNQIKFANNALAKAYFDKKSKEIIKQIVLHNTVINKDTAGDVVVLSSSQHSENQNETILKTDFGQVVMYYCTQEEEQYDYTKVEYEAVTTYDRKTTTLPDGSVVEEPVPIIETIKKEIPSKGVRIVTVNNSTKVSEDLKTLASL